MTSLRIVCAVVVIGVAAQSFAQGYQWLAEREPVSTVAERIQPPSGFERIKADSSSFTQWLRGLPLKKDGVPVYYYNGDLKTYQDAHNAVIDVDIGNRDLQQCADAVIRMRAEYFFDRQMYDSIAFNFTSGDRATFKSWLKGDRPVVNGNNVRWRRVADIDSSYQSFRTYLDTVFMYAGTYSLSREMKSKSNTCDIAPGDVFIQGGFPGHAVMVMDVAVNRDTGERIFILAQGFTPAQDIHILKNPTDDKLSPWYNCNFGDTLKTPQWIFLRSDLKTF